MYIYIYYQVNVSKTLEHSPFNDQWQFSSYNLLNLYLPNQKSWVKFLQRSFNNMQLESIQSQVDQVHLNAQEVPPGSAEPTAARLLPCQGPWVHSPAVPAGG